MAGWTHTGVAAPISSWTNHDNGQKSVCFPTIAAGNVGEWQDFAFNCAVEFAKLCRQKGWGTNKTCAFSANNGAGDTAGVGTLTITFTVA